MRLPEDSCSYSGHPKYGSTKNQVNNFENLIRHSLAILVANSLYKFSPDLVSQGQENYGYIRSMPQGE